MTDYSEASPKSCPLTSLGSKYNQPIADSNQETAVGGGGGWHQLPQLYQLQDNLIVGRVDEDGRGSEN